MTKLSGIDKVWIKRLVHNTPWFLGGGDDLVEQISDLAVREKVVRGSYVFCAGDMLDRLIMPIFGRSEILLSSPSGDDVLFAYVNLKEWIGEPVFSNPRPQSISIRAITDVYNLTFNAREFARIIAKDTAVLERILEDQFTRRSNIFALMETRLHQKLERRLASRLLQLANTFGETQSGRVRLKYPTNQEELARNVMTCRQSINRILKQWENDDILHRVKNYYVIDPTALQDLIS
ncbi:MAG: Crp/Fnr family transcriptional regulator [Halieaceae bacterium]|nr:Crp/Fnr family transcriptional regulator [Halieaceae bacterium]